ncbi:hypothetical protein NXS19_008139 [Fusarium pseudograminearum]|nr:hypothetical protein NXS19_008139 [Fusarium pseudograminearum]
MPITASIDALQRMQWVLDLANHNAQSSSNKIQAALAWPVIVPEDYIDALYLRHPEALAVLAFFSPLLANHLGPFWKEGLSWPLSKLVSS